MLALLLCAVGLTVPSDSIHRALNGHEGAFVLIDCASGAASRSDVAACAERLPPCSTFKIWNTAIGLELKEISRPDEPFWKWDGTKQPYEAWNRDLTLKEAYDASCVPAFQALARKTGKERMQEWIDKIGYGDKDLSAGVDNFWLPAHERKKTVIISPDEQAELIRKLAQGQLPFSAQTLRVLKEVMFIEKTEQGSLYGKTGTSGTYINADGTFRTGVGWFAGYVESGGKTYAFAAVLKSKGITGKDARAVVESILVQQKLL